jgi:hypothetical protein
LPPLGDYPHASDLAEEMVEERRVVRGMPRADSLAFNPDDGGLWRDVRDAHARIAPMFWGPRVSLDVACERVRRWIANNLVATAS